MYYISDFCRVCLQYDKPLVDILKKETEPETLINKLKLCVSEVEWSKDDAVLMCQPCIEKLNSAFEFKRQCLQSAQALASYISQLEDADSEESRVESKVYVSVSRNDVSQDLVDEYVKIQKEEEQSQKPTSFIRVKSNQQLYPQVPNIILTANNTNQNTFQNIFLNLIPSSAIKYQPPTIPNLAFMNRINSVNVRPPPHKDANQNMFVNINNTLHKIFPIVTQAKEGKVVNPPPQAPVRTPEEVNISRILTESKTEELSVEIDPMCFDCEDDRMPEDNAKDWEELISSNKIGPEMLNKPPKPKLIPGGIPALTKLSPPPHLPQPPHLPHPPPPPHLPQPHLNNMDFPHRFDKPYAPVPPPPLNNYIPIRPKAKDFITADLEEKMMEFLNVDHFMVPRERINHLNEMCPKPLMCEQCGQMCDTLKALRYHIKQFHLGKFPHKCKYCSSVYALRTQYEAHMQKHMMHTSDAFSKDTITLEDLSTQNEALLFPKSVPPAPIPSTPPASIEPKPVEVVEDNGVQLEFKCEMCPRSFNSAHGLSRHKVRKHNEQTRRKYFVKGMKNAKCDICNREFSTQSYLQLHIKLHYRKNDYRLKVFNKDKYEQEKKEQENENKEKNDESVESNVDEEAKEAEPEPEVDNKENSEEAPKETEPEKPENKEKSEETTKMDATPPPKEDDQPMKGIKIKINLRNLKQRQNSEEPEQEKTEENSVNNSIGVTPMEVDSSKEEAVLNGDLNNDKEERNSTCEDRTSSDSSEASPDMSMDCADTRELLSPNAELSEEAESLKDEGSPEGRRPPIKVVLVDGKPQCTFCYKLFSRRHELKRHLNNVHLKAIQYTCHLCNGQFHEAFQLTRHLRQHNGCMRCAACMTEFSALRDLKLHMSSAHEGAVSSQCGTCGQSFQRAKHLREHLQEHDKSLVYKCHICSDEFQECRELTRHLVAHSGMHACTVCHTTFAEEKELLGHSQCHSAEAASDKRYECEVCHDRFKKKRYLVAHMSTSHSADDSAVLNDRVESDNDSS